jgi:hypothetical protein
MMDSPEMAGLAAYMQGRRSEKDQPKDKKSKDDDDTDEDDKPKYSAREYDKLKRRLAASDKRQGLLQKQLDDLKVGKEGELDKAVKAEIDELKPRVSRLDSDNKTLRLQVAFLGTQIKGVVWQDPDAAMRLIDLSDVDIDPETGAVDKRDLAAAMRRLAKDKPYLVKNAKDDDKDDDTSSSGREMNGRRKGRRTNEPDRAALAKRFPVLGR